MIKKQNAMKALKYILFSIIGLLVIYLSFGLIHPAVHYGTEITVNKSVEEAWAVAEDESKFSQWLEGFQSMELISGKEKEIGSKYKVIVNPGNGQDDFEMIETLIARKENEHIEMHFDSDMMDFEQIVTYTEEEGKTKIKSDSKVIGKNIFTKSMFALMEIMGGTFSAQEAKNFGNLKKLIDENSTNYSPPVNGQKVVVAGKKTVD